MSRANDSGNSVPIVMSSAPWALDSSSSLNFAAPSWSGCCWPFDLPPSCLLPHPTCIILLCRLQDFIQSNMSVMVKDSFGQAMTSAAQPLSCSLTFASPQNQARLGLARVAHRWYCFGHNVLLLPLLVNLCTPQAQYTIKGGVSVTVNGSATFSAAVVLAPRLQ